MIAPQIANPRPKRSLSEWFFFKINFSIKNVKRGANVPRKVALAMLVSLMDPKNKANESQGGFLQ